MNDNDIIQTNQVAIMRALRWLLLSAQRGNAKELSEREAATEAHLHAKLHPDRRQSFQDGRGANPQFAPKPSSDIP